MQIVIGGQSHAVLAAYCTNGFKKWKVFNAGETVSDQEVKAFIESLAPYIRNKTVAILDNASNQRTDCVRIALERIFFAGSTSTVRLIHPGLSQLNEDSQW